MRYRFDLIFFEIETLGNLHAICRATILRVLGKIGDEETIQEAQKRFENHLNGALIPADLRSAVILNIKFCYV